jgi:hypothetical protein
VTGIHNRIANAIRLAAPPAGLGFAVCALLRFPPTRYSFYPQCPIHELLHLQCPGCGGTRAIAALLRGQFVQAMHFNALVTLLLPVAAIYGILCYRRFAQRRPLRWPHPPPIAIYAMFGLMVIFTAIRNL